MDGTTVERELKLEAPDSFSLARLEPRLDEYVASPVTLERLHTVYYDTDDLRLSRWGCSLRFRSGEGWTLKLPVPHEAKALYREEHEFPGDASRIPPEALDLATAYLRGAVPHAVAELRTLRTKRHMSADDGAEVAEVVEDDVRVVEGTHVVRRFRQIEIELREGADDALLDVLGDALRSEGAGKPDPVPKNVRAIGGHAGEPELDVPTLDSNSTIGEVARATFARSVEQFVRFDAKLRLHADEESIHQARVAVRRLRSDLRTFCSILDETWATGLGERIGWLQDGLSAARDGDVLIASLQRHGEPLPDADRHCIDDVLEPFRAARDRAYENVRTMLRDSRYVALLQELVDAAKRPPFTASAEDVACDTIPAIMRSTWKTLRKRVRARGRPPADRDLHAIRIAAKRMRYAAEAVAPVIGSAARRFAARVERVQTILGEHHDAVVARDRLRSLTDDRERAFLAGELAALENEASRVARREWRAAWRDASRKRVRFWRT